MKHGTISAYTNNKCRCEECLQANREYHRDWRKRNPKYFLTKKQKQRQQKRRMLDEVKAVPCADCGNTYPPECMDFDHLPGYEKLFTVGQAVMTQVSWARVLAEIEKCEVVCANCHRIRTEARRKQKYQTVEEPHD